MAVIARSVATKQSSCRSAEIASPRAQSQASAWDGMFTGIIEEMGVVKEVIKTRQGSSVSILAKTVLEGQRVGDSVTVNGVCLTVVGFDPTGMKADISPDAAKLTTSASLKAGEPLNLER